MIEFDWYIHLFLLRQVIINIFEISQIHTTNFDEGLSILRKKYNKLFSTNNQRQLNTLELFRTINRYVLQNDDYFSKYRIFERQDWEIHFLEINLQTNQIERIFNKIWKDFFIYSYQSDNIDVDLDVIGNIYHSFHLSSQKKTLQNGTVYTPLAEIEITILFSLWHFLINNNEFLAGNQQQLNKLLILLMKTPFEEIKDIKPNQQLKPKVITELFHQLQKIAILDPACGSGWFIKAFLHQFLKLYVLYNHVSSVEIKSFKIPEIYGIDVDPIAILITDLQLKSILRNFSKLHSTFSLNDSYTHIHVETGDYLINSPFSTTKVDLVIGNPPYIRHRDISHPFIKNSEKNREYRKKIRKSLLKYPEFSQKISNRIDYALYFYFHGLAQLKKNGVLGYITSNSWMNVKYGYRFQEFLLKNYHIKYLLENTSRSFQDVQINTIISIIQKPQSLNLHKNRILFLRINQPFEKFIKVLEWEFFQEVQNDFSLRTKKDKRLRISEGEYFKYLTMTHGYRSLCLPQSFVYLFNTDHEDNEKNLLNFSYKGYNWNNFYFYGPIWFLEIWQKIGSQVLRLNNIAEIKRGITTNCNKYFLLTKIGSNLYENGYGDQFSLPPTVLNPILSSPRQIINPRIEKSQLNTYLFNCRQSKGQLKKSNKSKILEYIKYGETRPILVRRGAMKGKTIKGVCNLASFSSKYSRDPDTWFILSSHILDSKEDDKILIQKIFDTTYKIALVDKKVIPNNTFYQIELFSQYQNQTSLVIAFLLSTFTKLSLEMQGRVNFGGGALDTATFDIGNILIPNIDAINDIEKEKLIQWSNKLIEMPFTDMKAKVDNIYLRNIDEWIINYLNLEMDLGNFYNIVQEIMGLRIGKKHL